MSVYARKATEALGDPHQPTSSDRAVSKAQVYAVLDLAQAVREVANILSDLTPQQPAAQPEGAER